MPLSFEIRLEDRQPDRVRVSAVLVPKGGPVRLDGVAVELFSHRRESLSPRVLLPISGTLAQKIAVRVELRCEAPPMPPGAMIVGTAWWDDDQLRAYCPADPWTELEAHVRGKRCVSRMPSCDIDVSSLRPEERARLAAAFPWVEHRRDPCQAAKFAKMEPVDALDVVDEITDELGLDPENAAWLRQLLAEEDEA